MQLPIGIQTTIQQLNYYFEDYMSNIMHNNEVHEGETKVRKQRVESIVSIYKENMSHHHAI